MPRDTLFTRIGRLFSSADQAEIARAGDALGRHAEDIMRMRGVMSVGVGHAADGRPAIVVGVTDPRSPSIESLPADIDGVPVIVQEIGRPEAQ